MKTRWTRKKASSSRLTGTFRLRKSKIADNLLIIAEINDIIKLMIV